MTDNAKHHVTQHDIQTYTHIHYVRMDVTWPDVTWHYKEQTHADLVKDSSHRPTNSLARHETAIKGSPPPLWQMQACRIQWYVDTVHYLALLDTLFYSTHRYITLHTHTTTLHCITLFQCAYVHLHLIWIRNALECIAFRHIHLLGWCFSYCFQTSWMSLAIIIVSRSE